MKKRILKNKILELFKSSPDKNFSFSRITEALYLKKKDHRKCSRVLSDLIEEGLIDRVGSSYKLSTMVKEEKVAYVSQIKGKGIVLHTVDGDSFEINRKAAGYIRVGDKIKLHIERSCGNINIRLENTESTRSCVGTVVKEYDRMYVVPFNRMLARNLRIIDSKVDVTAGDIVEVEADFLNGKGSCRIKRVIDSATAHDADFEMVISEYGLKRDFDEDVYDEALNNMNKSIDYNNREDLRHLDIFTIDPETAKDFDDAISFRYFGNGIYEIGVHIADVSYYVQRGGSLDREAFERGNSYYFPAKVIPMLPHVLSNGICSLVPGEDRACVSIFMKFSVDGNMISRRFSRSVIRSSARLSYKQAFAVLKQAGFEGTKKAEVAADIESIPESVKKQLVELAYLIVKMRRKRFSSGSLDINIPECEVIIGGDGEVERIDLVENDIAHQVIEECMLAANECVATELTLAGKPVIYRVHEPPTENMLLSLAQALRMMGCRYWNLAENGRIHELLNLFGDRPIDRLYNYIVLRHLTRAVYSTKRLGHYGLAKELYSHFTSPIRRYPDLVLHRILLHHLGYDTTAPYTKEELNEIAFHCSATERLADDAERTILEYKKCRYIRKLISENNVPVYDAIITDVTEKGVMFVEIAQLLLSARLKDSVMDGRSHTRYHRRAILSKYKIGDIIKVYPVDVDMANRRVDVKLVRS